MSSSMRLAMTSAAAGSRAGGADAGGGLGALARLSGFPAISSLDRYDDINIENYIVNNFQRD
jgi:hypothetical protein